MTTPLRDRSVPIGWWRFQWPDSLNAHWTTFEETKPSLTDIFGRLLSIEDIAAFVRGQDHPAFTEEPFALLSETVIGHSLEGRNLSDADWDTIVMAAVDVVRNVVCRNYKEIQQHPTEFISDEGIRLKEFRCFEALYRAIGRSNRDYARFKVKVLRNEYFDDPDLNAFWDSLENELA